MQESPAPKPIRESQPVDGEPRPRVLQHENPPNTQWRPFPWNADPVEAAQPLPPFTL